MFPRRHAHVRETIEIMQGIWTNDLFEYHGEFADFERCGFGHKPVQKPHPPIYFSGLKDPKRSARRIAKYGLSGWIGIQDSPEDIKQLAREIQRELGEIGGRGRSTIRHVQHDLVRHHRRGDRPDAAGQGQQPAGGYRCADQDILKRYKEAGMTMPLLWPPFRDVPTSKTLDDLKRLTEEIMPKVNGM